jgi:lantibiotic biosynthesis dehydratase-like protein
VTSPAPSVRPLDRLPGHLVALGRHPWGLWRWSALRSAGMPARWAHELADDDLAAAAEQLNHDGPEAIERYREAHRKSARRSTELLIGLAGDPTFREAVTWQAPHLLPTCLDRLREPGREMSATPNSKTRQRLLTVGSYLQRYTVKNDSVGFFGPVGWAHWCDRDGRVTTTPGAGLFRRPRVYFESWTIDALARSLAADPELDPHLILRVAPHVLIDDAAVRDPLGRHTPLLPAEQAVLSACDGVRTHAEMLAAVINAGTDPAAAQAAVAALRSAGVLVDNLELPVATAPERLLRDELERCPDPAVRARTLSDLDDLDRARDAVQRSVGDPDRLATAMDELGERFRRITGREPARRPGENYAGRTPVYLDTVRDVTVKIGRDLLGDVADPLDLVLRSARWFVAEVGEAYRALFERLYDRIRVRTGSDEVPLAVLHAAATPELRYAFREPPPLVAEVADELCARWARVLMVPDGVATHVVDERQARPLVEREFPQRPLPWSAARYHSPDLMIIGDGTGEGPVAVLGELHVAVNTLASRLFVEQHPDPDLLALADEADHGGRRVVLVPSKRSGGVNSRTYPPALLSPGYRYWTQHPDGAVAAPHALPAAALSVVRSNGGLVVRCATDGRELDLLEVLGEPLTGAVMNAFGVLPSHGDHPRVSLGKLVVARRSWSHDARTLAWAREPDAAQRFARAWRWRCDAGLPRRCFYRSVAEDKPLFVDFSSVVLVDVFARLVRRTLADADPSEGDDTTVHLSEMLPDLDQLWLTDRQGLTYTSELRMVVVDRGSAGPTNTPGPK